MDLNGYFMVSLCYFTGMYEISQRLCETQWLNAGIPMP
jgi:hypothetical protein